MEYNVAEDLKAIARRYTPKRQAAVELNPSTLLAEEAGIDSLRMIDILLDIEDHFKIKLEETQFQSTRTFGDLVTLITRLIAESVETSDRQLQPERL